MKWLSKIPFAAAVTAAILCGGPLFARGTAACSGYDEVLVKAMEECPRARDLLGDDIGVSYYGMACGSTETSGRHGNASWRMPYAGSRGRGSLEFYANTFDDGTWQLRSATLEVDGEVIDLRRCAKEAR